MKKRKVVCATLVACLAVPCFAFLGGCNNEKAFYVTEHTSYLDLKEKLDAGNYSLLYHVYDYGEGEVSQLATYYDGNTMLDVAYLPIDGKLGIYRNYSFVNFEKGQLVQYNVGEMNLRINGSEMEVIDHFVIDYAEKTYLEYSTLYKTVGNFAFLTSYKNKLILKDGINATLEFRNGDVITTDTTDKKSCEITLTDIGTTNIHLPANIVKAGLNASWADEVLCDGVTYQAGYGGYEAVIDNNYWLTNSLAVVQSSINGVPVTGFSVETPKISYVGYTIWVFADCVEGQISNMGSPFEYSIADFVEKGGTVVFQNQIFKKTFVTENTSLESLTNLITAKNYTITKQMEQLLPNGDKNVLTETTTYANGEYIKETINQIGDDVYRTSEFGVFVSGIYYKVRYTNYDASGNLYLDGAFTYAYCSRADIAEQENLGANFLAKLKYENQKLMLKEDLENVENMSLNFVFGNPEIETLFVENIGNVFESCGKEVVKLSNIGSSKVLVPLYVYHKVIEQDADNPLHGQIFY